MFKGNIITSFSTSKDKAKVLQYMEESLEAIGNVQISDSGSIKIASSRFDGFSYKSEITGLIKESEGKYTLSFDYMFSPTAIGWVIAILLFPLGLAIFILPS